MCWEVRGTNKSYSGTFGSFNWKFLLISWDIIQSQDMLCIQKEYLDHPWYWPWCGWSAEGTLVSAGDSQTSSCHCLSSWPWEYSLDFWNQWGIFYFFLTMGAYHRWSNQEWTVFLIHEAVVTMEGNIHSNSGFWERASQAIASSNRHLNMVTKETPGTETNVWKPLLRFSFMLSVIWERSHN